MKLTEINIVYNLQHSPSNVFTINITVELKSKYYICQQSNLVSLDPKARGGKK